MKTLATLCLIPILFGSVFGQTSDTFPPKHHQHDHTELTWTQDPFGNEVAVISDPLSPIDDRESDAIFLKNFNLEAQLLKARLQGDAAQKAGIKIVRVYLAVDTEYIERNSDWFIRAFIVFNLSTPTFLSSAQIHYLFGGIFIWDSNGNNADQILDDLAADFSHLPDGILVGFTRDENYDAGGNAYVYQNDPGLGFSVVFDQSISNTAYALRHEIGHNYGMGHDEDNSVCLMNYSYAYSVTVFDAHHKKQLNDNRNYFGPLN